VTNPVEQSRLLLTLRGLRTELDPELPEERRAKMAALEEETAGNERLNLYDLLKKKESEIMEV
jgi:hypothetical protein